MFRALFASGLSRFNAVAMLNLKFLRLILQYSVPNWIWKLWLELQWWIFRCLHSSNKRCGTPTSVCRPSAHTYVPSCKKGKRWIRKSLSMKTSWMNRNLLPHPLILPAPLTTCHRLLKKRLKRKYAAVKVSGNSSGTTWSGLFLCMLGTTLPVLWPFDFHSFARY